MVDADQSFRGLDAADRRTAWVSGGSTTAGGDGAVLRTTDAGATWQDVSPAATTDGGRTWEVLPAAGMPASDGEDNFSRPQVSSPWAPPGARAETWPTWARTPPGCDVLPAPSS